MTKSVNPISKLDVNEDLPDPLGSTTVELTLDTEHRKNAI
jgi:hypothetical protein